MGKWATNIHAINMTLPLTAIAKIIKSGKEASSEKDTINEKKASSDRSNSSETFSSYLTIFFCVLNYSEEKKSSISQVLIR